MSWQNIKDRILDLSRKSSMERGLGPLEQFELDSLVLNNAELWQTFSESQVGQQIMEEWRTLLNKNRDAIGVLIIESVDKNRGRILYHQAMVDVLKRNINMVENMTAQYRVLSEDSNRPINPKEEVGT